MAELATYQRIEAESGLGGGKAQMPATLWTLVLTARDLQPFEAQTALARLCEIYWYPLYAFVRRQGHDHHEAQDLTQGFFEYLFTRDWLNGIDPAKGRFRTFLLRGLTRFLCNEHYRQNALKRGGGIQQFVSWDAESAEARHSAGPADEADPLTEFDRLWACALVAKALARVKDEYGRCGKTELFTSLCPFMTRPIPPGYYAEAAARLRMSEGALRIARHRLLHRFGELLRVEVAQTVAAPEEVDEELRAVLKAWAGK